MILADWSFVAQTGDGSAHDSSSQVKRQKIKATPRGSSKLNFLKSIQSLEVETPVVFMHFKEEVDEVKSMLLETIVRDGRKRRYYLMTKPLEVAFALSIKSASMPNLLVARFILGHGFRYVFTGHALSCICILPIYHDHIDDDPA